MHVASLYKRSTKNDSIFKLIILPWCMLHLLSVIVWHYSSRGHTWDQMDNHEALAERDDSLRISKLGYGTTETVSSSSNTIKNNISKLKMILREYYQGKPFTYWVLLLLSGGAMLIAFPASSLLSRVYFSNGGTRKWVISWVAVAGWPLTAIALFPTYIFCNSSPTRLNLKLTLCFAVMGLLSAVDNILYAYAYAYLPASTASLVTTSSLIFSVFFGYLLVGNRINASILNSVVMITTALTIIALDTNSDLYGNVSKTQYTIGFICDILGSALHGLIFALSELLFVKLLGRVSFHVVLEQQVMVSLFSFMFTTLGLVVGSTFQGMEEEGRNFKGGRISYCMVLIWGAITFQLGVLGATSVLFLASTMLAGVLNAVRVPLTSIAAVILLNDSMSGFKALSLVVTFWGFCSYIYGSRPSKHDHSATSN